MELLTPRELVFMAMTLSEAPPSDLVVFPVSTLHRIPDLFNKVKTAMNDDETLADTAGSNGEVILSKAEAIGMILHSLKGYEVPVHAGVKYV